MGNWLRNNDPGRLDTVDEATAVAFTNLAGIPYESRPSTAEERKHKAMKDALEWIRHGDPIVGDDPKAESVSALSKITGAPMPKKMNAENKKKFVDDCVNWLRNNDPGRLGTVDEATAVAFTNLAGIPYESRPFTADERKHKAMKDALEWIRNNDPIEGDDPKAESVSALSKITGAPMPKKMTAKNKKKF